MFLPGNHRGGGGGGNAHHASLGAGQLVLVGWLLYAGWKDQSRSMEASINMVSPVHERCQEMIFRERRHKPVTAQTQTPQATGATQRKVTINDVADAAGVGRQTV